MRGWGVEDGGIWPLSPGMAGQSRQSSALSVPPPLCLPLVAGISTDFCQDSVVTPL